MKAQSLRLPFSAVAALALRLLLPVEFRSSLTSKEELMKHDHTQFSRTQDTPQPAGLPPILIRRPDETYVGAARYERESRQHGWGPHAEEMKLPFRLPDGQGYVQAREMSALDAIKGTAHLRRALEVARLPMVYADSANHAVPTAMSQVKEDLFVAGISSGVTPDKIFIETTHRNAPSGTGNFISLEVHLRYRPDEGLAAVNDLDQPPCYARHASK